MTFTPKDWENAPSTDTPLSGAALEDLETRLAAYTDLVSAGYRQIIPWRAIAIAQSTAAATLVLPEGSPTPLAAATNDSPLALVYLDPADFAIAGRTTKYRLRSMLATNATAPAITVTTGLYPVSAVAGGSNVITLTLGAVVVGSTVAFASQGASTRGQGNSGDFDAPAAGWYALATVLSGTSAANSRMNLAACLQARNVA